MQFDWDDAKAFSNLRKHGVDFEAACDVFGDALALTVPNSIVFGEERWSSVGLVSGRLLYVVFTANESGGEELVRIITARKATRQERRDYERGT